MIMVLMIAIYILVFVGLYFFYPQPYFAIWKMITSSVVPDFLIKNGQYFNYYISGTTSVCQEVEYVEAKFPDERGKHRIGLKTNYDYGYEGLEAHSSFVWVTTMGQPDLEELELSFWEKRYTKFFFKKKKRQIEKQHEREYQEMKGKVLS